MEPKWRWTLAAFTIFLAGTLVVGGLSDGITFGSGSQIRGTRTTVEMGDRTLDLAPGAEQSYTSAVLRDAILQVSSQQGTPPGRYDLCLRIEPDDGAAKESCQRGLGAYSSTQPLPEGRVKITFRCHAGGTPCRILTDITLTMTIPNG